MSNTPLRKKQTIPMKHLSLFFLVLFTLPVYAEVPTALNDYVKTDDGAFKWETAETLESPAPTVKLQLLELTSQNWHGIVWKHYVLVAVPNEVKHKQHGLLYITGGRTGSKPSKKSEITAISLLAVQAGMPVAVLFQVPNQPLDIRNTAKSPNDWVEDNLLSESLIKAMETKDLTWAIHLPMTKSVIKAMDCLQQFYKRDYSLDVQKFIVGGASKRGWTTWLTGATLDKRVAGLVPIVYNNLNLVPQMEHQLAMWGDFSHRITEYTSRKLFVKGEKPDGFKKEILQLVDPYSYLENITIPKLLIHGANDPYWAVDATKLYWNDIKEPKYLITIPNAGHQDIDNPASLMQWIVPAVGAFCNNVASSNKFEPLKWTLTEKDKEYEIKIDPGDAFLKKSVLWTAYCDDNNFVKDNPRVKWESKDCGEERTLTIAKPEKGHIAFFVEVRDEINLRLTTEVWRF
jgi:PhoPQ-activated pathogenicity-related protein